MSQTVPLIYLEEVMGISRCPIIGCTWDEIEILAKEVSQIRSQGKRLRGYLQEPLALCLLLVFDLVGKRVHYSVWPKDSCGGGDSAALLEAKRAKLQSRLKRRFGNIMGDTIYGYLRECVVDVIEEKTKGITSFNSVPDKNDNTSQIVGRRLRIIDDFRESCDEVLGAKLVDIFKQCIEIAECSGLKMYCKNLDDFLLSLALSGAFQGSSIEYNRSIVPKCKLDEYL